MDTYVLSAKGYFGEEVYYNSRLCAAVDDISKATHYTLDDALTVSRAIRIITRQHYKVVRDPN